MKARFRSLKIYLILLGIYLSVLSVLLLILPHGSLVECFNKLHTPAADLFFKYWTWLGDGVLLPFIVLLLCFIRYYYAVTAAVAFLITGITVQVMKRVFYSGAPRPKTFFGDNYPVNTIEGVDIHGFQSFPSGHTADAFVVAIILAFVFHKQWLQAVFFLMAVLVAVSRIYLFQHFLGDTFLGAVIGSVAGLLAILICCQWMGLQEKTRFKKRLLG